MLDPDLRRRGVDTVPGLAFERRIEIDLRRLGVAMSAVVVEGDTAEEVGAADVGERMAVMRGRACVWTGTDGKNDAVDAGKLYTMREGLRVMARVMMAVYASPL